MKDMEEANAAALEEQSRRIRLRETWERQGRWEEASAFLEGVREKVIAQGMLEPEASAFAWTRAEIAYPLKLEGNRFGEKKGRWKQQGGKEAKEVLEQYGDPQGQPDLRVPKSWGSLPGGVREREEVEWVAQNIGLVVKDRGQKPRYVLQRALRPAPSHRALNFLAFAVGNWNTFWKDVYPKYTAGSDEERDGGRRERMKIEEISRILDEMEVVVE